MRHCKDELPAPRRDLISGSQGTGKTRRAPHAVADLPALPGRISAAPRLITWVTEPSLEKAEEAHRDYSAAVRPGSPPGMIVRGRGADDPSAAPGTKMCPRHVVANCAAQKGVEVRKAMCPKCPPRPMDGKAGCGYLRQEAHIATLGDFAVFFMATAYNFLPCPAPRPDLLLIDEDITAMACDSPVVVRPEVRTQPLNYKGRPSSLDAVTRVSTVTAALLETLRTPRPLDHVGEHTTVLMTDDTANPLLVAGCSRA